MALLNIAPTKSNLLAMRRQLAFAEEGYDLLEQKRQILVFELMSRLGRAREAERRLDEALREARGALREARLDVGSEALDRAILGVPMRHRVDLGERRVMGIAVPRVALSLGPGGPHFGVGGTSVNADRAMRRFVDLLPLVAQLAELQNAIIRLARELRKTQRRCNVLSKTFIPNYRDTIAYMMGALEEREREAFVVLKMIRDRLEAREDSPAPAVCRT